MGIFFISYIYIYIYILYLYLYNIIKQLVFAQDFNNIIIMNGTKLILIILLFQIVYFKQTQKKSKSDLFKLDASIYLHIYI